MLILACDTTGKSLAVALVRDGRLVGDRRYLLGYNHAVTHMPQVMDLLATCEVEPAEIDLFACTTGPGSFTGTRIGLSSFKAMAYAAGKPLVGVSTLEVLAWPWRQGPPAVLVPLLDARHGRVYAAACTRSALTAPLQPEGPAWLLRPGNFQTTEFWQLLTALLRRPDLQDLPVFLTGDGSPALLSLTETEASEAVPALRQPFVRLDALADVPSASVTAALAAAYAAVGVVTDPFQVKAAYLALPSAERRLQPREMG